MTIQRLWRLALASGAVLTLGQSALAATYTYQGVNYSQVSGGNCLTTNEYLSIKLILPKKLPKNQVGVVANPTSWTAFDGANYVRSTSSNAGGHFTFNTDANRNITQYQVSITLQRAGALIINISSASAQYSGPGDNALDGLCHGGKNNPSDAFNFIDGTWTGH